VNPRRDQSFTFLVTRRFWAFLSLAVCLTMSPAVHAQVPILQFIQPTNGAIYSTLDEVPVMLRAVASNDLFLSADVFANLAKIATVSYCCTLCPCYHPIEGQDPRPVGGGQAPVAPVARVDERFGEKLSANGTGLRPKRYNSRRSASEHHCH
jgi:hypothetical protein